MFSTIRVHLSPPIFTVVVNPSGGLPSCVETGRRSRVGSRRGRGRVGEGRLRQRVRRRKHRHSKVVLFELVRTGTRPTRTFSFLRSPSPSLPRVLGRPNPRELQSVSGRLSTRSSTDLLGPATGRKSRPSTLSLPQNITTRVTLVLGKDPSPWSTLGGGVLGAVGWSLELVFLR